MALNSEKISRGKQVATLIGVLGAGAAAIAGASDNVLHFQSKGIVYEMRNGVATPITSPDYPVLFNSRNPYIDLNGSGDKQSFEPELTTGQNSFTDEATKTMNFWKAKEARGITEIAYFTYFSEYHRQRNLFSVGTDGKLSMGPYQFILNQAGTSFIYDKDLSGAESRGDVPMGNQFNSNVIPQLKSIMELAKNAGDAERRLSEAQSAEQYSSERVAELEAEISNLKNQISGANGNGVTPSVNGHQTGISQEEYDAKVAELASLRTEHDGYKAKTDMELHNYQNQVASLRTDLSNLQTTLTSSQGRVGELEALVAKTQQLQQSTEARASTLEGQLNVYRERESTAEAPSEEEKLQELATRELVPLQTNMNLAETSETAQQAERTVEDVYLAGTDAPAPKSTFKGTAQLTEGSEGDFNAGARVLPAWVPEAYQNPETRDAVEEAHHREAVKTAQSRYVPTEEAVAPETERERTGFGVTATFASGALGVYKNRAGQLTGQGSSGSIGIRASLDFPISRALRLGPVISGDYGFSQLAESYTTEPGVTGRYFGSETTKNSFLGLEAGLQLSGKNFYVGGTAGVRIETENSSLIMYKADGTPFLDVNGEPVRDTTFSQPKAAFDWSIYAGVQGNGVVAPKFGIGYGKRGLEAELGLKVTPKPYSTHFR